MKAQCPKPLMSLVIYESPVSLATWSLVFYESPVSLAAWSLVFYESPVSLAINVLGHLCYILVSLGYSQPWLQSSLLQSALVTVSLGYSQPWLQSSFLQSALVTVIIPPVSLGYSHHSSSQPWLQSSFLQWRNDDCNQG